MVTPPPFPNERCIDVEIVPETGQQLKQHEEAAAKAKLAAGQKEVWFLGDSTFLAGKSLGKHGKIMGQCTIKMEESFKNGAFLYGLVVAGRGSLYPLQWIITPHVRGIGITPVWV